MQFAKGSPLGDVVVHSQEPRGVLVEAGWEDQHDQEWHNVKHRMNGIENEWHHHAVWR